MHNCNDVTIANNNIISLHCSKKGTAVTKEIANHSISQVHQINKIQVFLNGITHGAHKIKLELFQLLNEDKGTRGVAAPSLSFEIATKKANDTTPIIWLGAFKNKYYNYETINIPYMVYNPSNVNNAHIIYNKNNSNIGEVDITNMSDYTYWEIPYEGLGVNTYKIICGGYIPLSILAILSLKT